MGRISTLISQRKFRIWGIAAILVVTMAALAGGIATGATATCDNPNVASIQTLPSSSFEIDTNANLKVDDPDCIDWFAGSSESSGFRSGVDWKRDTPSGSTDESFTQGTKEDTSEPVIETGSIPPNKSDLKAFGTYTEDLAGTDGTLALFWSRVQDPSGTTNMDFELNQKYCDPQAPTADTCAPNNLTPDRTGDGNGPLNDDILITYDLSRGGTQATISIRKWGGSAWGPATNITQQNEALGTINSTEIGVSPIDVPPGNPDTSLDPRTFGEAAVTFDALFGNNACGAFGSAYLKSRSSDSFTAALKDFVPPEQVNISNCPSSLTTDATDSATLGATPPNNQIRDTATLNVPGGSTGSIEFKLYGPFANAGAITSSSCTADKLVSGATSTATVSGPGSYNSALFTPTLAGTYNWTAQFTSTTPGVDSTGVFGCGVALEQSVVNPASPNLTTNATQQVTIGSPIKDTATLTGATSNATGGITFKLYGPFDPDSPASGDTCVDSGTGANLVTTLGPVNIGNPDATTGDYVIDSPEYTPEQSGRYQWVASYDSDDGNNNDFTSDCRAPNEASVVGKAPANVDTAQELFPQDSATLSATAGGTPTGTVTFKLYGPDNPTCSASGADPVYTENDVTLTNGTANTNNTTFSVDQAKSGNYKWLVTYSGDEDHNDATSACGKEAFTATVDNDTTN